MGILDLSPDKVRIVRDVAVIGIVGYFFVIGMVYTFMSLQNMAFGLIP